MGLTGCAESPGHLADRAPATSDAPHCGMSQNADELSH